VYVDDDGNSCYPGYPWYAKGPDRLEDFEHIHVLKISEEGRFRRAFVMRCLCHQTGEYKRIGVIHTSISNSPTMLKGFASVEDRVVNINLTHYHYCAIYKSFLLRLFSSQMVLMRIRLFLKTVASVPFEFEPGRAIKVTTTTGQMAVTPCSHGPFIQSQYSYLVESIVLTILASAVSRYQRACLCL
jgi:hypothetical protein